MKQSVIYDLYPIVDGCAVECSFTGSDEECSAFASRLRVLNPDFDYILLPYGY